jgi:hypothetical protein
MHEFAHDGREQQHLSGEGGQQCLGVQEQIGTEGVGHHLGVFMPEMGLQVVDNYLDLFHEGVVLEFATGLMPDDVEAALKLALTQDVELAPFPRTV